MQGQDKNDDQAELRSGTLEHRSLAAERFRRDCWIEGNPPPYADGMCLYLEYGLHLKGAITMIDISDWKYAEAIFHFIQTPDIYEDFQIHRELEALSMAEYVALYKIEEFADWYKTYKDIFD